MRALPSRDVSHDAMARERIVDLVFHSVDSGQPRFRIGLAFIAALVAHGALGFMAFHVEPSLESWSADLALRVHTELGREEIVELPPPPPPPKEEPQPPEPPPAAKLTPPTTERQPRETKPPPPAQAGNIIAQEPDPNAPADLTGNTFVTGSATAYAGGITTSHGTSSQAVHSRIVDPESPPRSFQVDHSSPVQLPSGQWDCPWPQEADDEQINEQTVVIRVVVRADGSVESVKVVEDPGHGFGRAAAACARAARFSPAKGRMGTAIREESPPIRVRFTR